MKRIIVFATILLVVLSSNVGAVDLGKKLALRLINLPLNPAMDTGVYNAIKWPDSVAVATWATSGADTGNTTSQVVFGSSTTTVTAAGLAALGIRADTVGAPMFVLCDTLRILNAGTTTRQLTGMVTLWKYGAPFTTQFTVYVAGDTAEAALVITDTINAILDTLQLHDNWLRDSVHNQSAAVLALAASAANLTKVIDTVNGILDTLQLYDNWLRDSIHNQGVVVNTEVTKVKDTVNGILDTLQLYDNWLRDSIHNQSVVVNTEVTKVKDTVNATLDTLQLYDNWLRDSVHNQSTAVLAVGATSANQTKIIDTVNAILDTLQLYDNWLRDSIHNQSVTVNTQVTKVIDTVNGVMDTLQNASSDLRASGSGATAAEVKAALFADTSKQIGFAGGAGDSVKAATTATVGGTVTLSAGEYTKIADSVGLDSAKFARSVWDNDVVARANRTIDEVDTIVLACINGDTVANAGDFLKTALNYRDEIKNIFGVATSNSTWMTDTVLNQLIRQAVVKVNPLMRGVKFKDTVVTAWQQSDYNLDSMIGVISVSWQKEDTVRPIVYSPLETWGALTHQSTWGGDDPYLSRPSVYDVTDNQIMFFPPPTQTDTIEIVGFRKVYGIVTTADFSAIPQAYRIPVLYYAAYLVAQSKQHPGTDRLLNEYNKSVADILVALNRRANAPTDSK